MDNLKDILRLRVWPFLILPNLVFGIIAYYSSAEWFIRTLNFLLVALATGVCCAYGPPALKTLFTRKPMTDSECLSLGIFISWMSVLELRIWSQTWRWMGMPAALTSTDLVSYGLFMSAAAAVLHLGAPGGINGHVPTVRWLKIGVIVAIVVLTTLLLGWSFSVADLTERYVSIG